MSDGVAGELIFSGMKLIAESVQASTVSSNIF